MCDIRRNRYLINYYTTKLKLCETQFVSLSFILRVQSRVKRVFNDQPERYVFRNIEDVWMTLSRNLVHILKTCLPSTKPTENETNIAMAPKVATKPVDRKQQPN